MFVLSNAWRALTRSKGRTALTAFITLAVTFGTVAGLAIIQEDTNAHTTTYDQQKATLAIRPTAATWKKVSATDSASTKHYMTWTSYTEYATLVQSATNSLNFTVTETVPARVSGDLKALDGGSLGSASDDETGGQLIWRAFWTKDSAKASDLGTFEIVDGKDLSYNNQSSNPNTTGALVSEAFASANNLKVGDTLEVAAASDAKTTAKLKVRGIYKYTSESAVANPVTAARNRENAIFTNYQTFAKAGLDPQSTDKTVSGWAVPDLDVVFDAGDSATYKSLVSTLKKSKLPAKGYEFSSPSLESYNASLEPLDTLSSRAKTGTIVLVAVGGVLLLILVLSGVWASKRDDEIGMALGSGVTRGRLGWQFMLEVFIVTLPFYVIGLVGGAFAANPIGSALASGHATPVTSGLIWTMVWYGLGSILILAILAALRLAFFSANKLFAADGDWGTVSETNKTTTTTDDAEAQELEKTTDATADEATSETETNDTIESVPADSMQFSVTFDDVDDEGTVDDGIYSALASAETGETDETSEAEADAIASANASAEVTERNAARVNETLRLAKTDHKDALAEHTEPQGKASEPTMTLASRIDRVLVGGGSDDILLKTYPTFALNKVTVAGPKGKVNILDGANFFCYSGHAYALLISDDPDSGITADAKRRALMGVMSGLTTPASGTVMNKSANIVELEPVELRGHRLGIVPQLHAVQPKIDAEQNVLYAMNASNRNFLKPKPVIARELLAKVGFSEATSGVAVGTLPLVQQRLVAIARAISTEAEVLILDEPTRGLNADDEVTVFAALAKLAHTGDPKHCVIVLTASREIAEAADTLFEI